MLQLRSDYETHRNKLINYIEMLCGRFKSKATYTQHCINILDKKIRENKIVNYYSYDNIKHLYIMTVCVWWIVDKFIEDEHVSLCKLSNVCNIDKKIIIKAEMEIFREFNNISDWLQRPRSKSL